MRYSQSLPSGRPPREKSQTKSQRRPTSGDAQLRQATVGPGQVPAERHRATSSDARNVTGGQGVAGSNPAVPTSNRVFSNIITPHKSQQKSQLVVQRPFNRRAPIGCHGVLTGHVPIPHSRRRPTVRESRSLNHPKSARPPRQLRIGGHHPRPPAGQHLRDAGRPRCSSQACPRRRRSEAAGPRAATTVAIFTATWTQAASSPWRKCHLGQQPMRCTDK